VPTYVPGSSTPAFRVPMFGLCPAGWTRNVYAHSGHTATQGRRSGVGVKVERPPDERLDAGEDRSAMGTVTEGHTRELFPSPLESGGGGSGLFRPWLGAYVKGVFAR
jgi:hypothetical protein